VSEKALFAEEFGLGWRCGGSRVSGSVARGAACDADDAENLHFRERGAGNEDFQAVAVKIGRGELDAGVEQIEKIVCDDPFQHVLVAEAQAHPKAVELRTAEKRFAVGLEVLRKFADEVDGFHFFHVDGAVLAVGSQQIDRLRAAEARAIQIAAHGTAVEQKDDDLLECGCCGPAFGASHLSSELRIDGTHRTPLNAEGESHGFEVVTMRHGAEPLSGSLKKALICRIKDGNSFREVQICDAQILGD